MTFSKEWLQQTIAAMESQRDEAPFGISDDHDMTIEAFKLALAGMEAEPAYFINRVKRSDAYGDDVELRTYCYELDALKSKDDFGGEVVPVYTAPQPLTTSERSELENYRSAQQVVPVEATSDDCPAFIKYDVTEVDEAWARGFNACRAAMQGKADGNSPVIPDGWVMVPVEPTEDMCNVSHIGVDVYTGLARDDEYYSIGGVCAAKVYRAMLAAAPQQE